MLSSERNKLKARFGLPEAPYQYGVWLWLNEFSADTAHSIPAPINAVLLAATQTIESAQYLTQRLDDLIDGLEGPEQFLSTNTAMTIVNAFNGLRIEGCFLRAYWTDPQRGPYCLRLLEDQGPKLEQSKRQLEALLQFIHSKTD